MTTFFSFLQNGSRVSNDELDVRMLIHQSQAGCVIGKSGSKIKELRDVSVHTFAYIKDPLLYDNASQKFETLALPAIVHIRNFDVV